ncbi:pseudoazurin [Oryzisolibacter sp. LB2S]|uniref:pseudoazurin n=1 Tax=Alicycliphilus soli TaxID=3228789 RepID=UPI00345B4BC0
MNHRIPLMALLLGAALGVSSVQAETIEIKMRNRGEGGAMVYEPDFVRLAPGDRLKFLATNRTHNAASMPEILPPAAKPFMGRIDEEIEVTFDEPGLYGIKCLPHYAMGMVMLVQVGDAPLSALQLPDSVPAKARERLQDIVTRQTR